MGNTLWAEHCPGDSVVIQMPIFSGAFLSLTKCAAYGVLTSLWESLVVSYVEVGCHVTISSLLHMAPLGI